MKNLLKKEDRRRSCSVEMRPRLMVKPMLLSVLLGSVLILPATAEETQPPTGRPDILIVPRQLAPVPQSVVRSNSSDRAESIRQLAYATAAAPLARKNKQHMNKTGIAIAPAVDHTTYVGAYGSIPFSRTEFEANPSYRHEATMEILFGKLRPMVIHKYVPRANPPQLGFDNYGRYPFGSGHFGGGYRNYNFYYPRPTVYRHY